MHERYGSEEGSAAVRSLHTLAFLDLRLPAALSALAGSPQPRCSAQPAAGSGMEGLSASLAGLNLGVADADETIESSAEAAGTGASRAAQGPPAEARLAGMGPVLEALREVGVLYLLRAACCCTGRAGGRAGGGAAARGGPSQALQAKRADPAAVRGHCR